MTFRMLKESRPKTAIVYQLLHRNYQCHLCRRSLTMDSIDPMWLVKVHSDLWGTTMHLTISSPFGPGNRSIGSWVPLRERFMLRIDSALRSWPQLLDFSFAFAGPHNGVGAVKENRFNLALSLFGYVQLCFSSQRSGLFCRRTFLTSNWACASLRWALIFRHFPSTITWASIGSLISAASGAIGGTLTLYIPWRLVLRKSMRCCEMGIVKYLIADVLPCKIRREEENAITHKICDQVRKVIYLLPRDIRIVNSWHFFWDFHAKKINEFIYECRSQLSLVRFDWKYKMWSHLLVTSRKP